MTLDEYMTRNEVSATKMAGLSGCSVGYVGRLRRGERRPSMDVAERIEAATAGLVPVSSWTSRKEAA